jgi:transposase-like protein
LALPKLRTGTYFPEWLLERRKRAERALTSVVATCYLLGVSTRRMDKLVQSLGITGLSKSQVSEMAKDLDEHVEQFRTRRLDDAGPFTFVAADALVLSGTNGPGRPRSRYGAGTEPQGLKTRASEPKQIHVSGIMLRDLMNALMRARPGKL